MLALYAVTESGCTSLDSWWNNESLRDHVWCEHFSLTLTTVQCARSFIETDNKELL